MVLTGPSESLLDEEEGAVRGDASGDVDGEGGKDPDGEAGDILGERGWSSFEVASFGSR